MITEIRLWLDSAGLLAQCLILIYAVFRMYREDWPFAMTYGITSILSFFSFIAPAYPQAVQLIIRQGLNTFTVFSFAAFVIYTVRDIPASEGRFKLSTRNVITAFLVFILTLFGIARVTIPIGMSRDTTILESVNKKADKAQKNALEARKAAEQTRRAIQADSSEARYRTELLEDISDDVRKLVIPVRLDVHSINLKLTRLQMDMDKRDAENKKLLRELIRRDSTNKR